MTNPVRVLAIPGSLREASFNRRLIHIAAAAVRKAGGEFTVLDLREHPLPLMDEDLEAREGLPPNAARLKELFRAHDALLFATPEYNSSLPAVLKNVIDWVSRPEPNQPPLSCFVGKVAAIMAASPGALGGLRCLYHLRAILQNINVMVLPEMRAVSRAHEAFTSAGELADAGVQAAVQRIAAALVECASKLRK